MPAYERAPTKDSGCRRSDTNLMMTGDSRGPGTSTLLHFDKHGSILPESACKPPRHVQLERRTFASFLIRYSSWEERRRAAIQGVLNSRNYRDLACTHHDANVRNYFHSTTKKSAVFSGANVVCFMINERVAMLLHYCHQSSIQPVHTNDGRTQLFKHQPSATYSMPPELNVAGLARTTRKTIERLAPFSQMRLPSSSSDSEAPAAAAAITSKISSKILAYIEILDSSMLAAQIAFHLASEGLVLSTSPQDQEWEVDSEGTIERMRAKAERGLEEARKVERVTRDVPQEFYKIAALTKDKTTIVLLPPDPVHPSVGDRGMVVVGPRRPPFKQLRPSLFPFNAMETHQK
ncbi:uncharacterized protein LACBIDRAFT_330573 [Laccaria bicolor S238N-H82]|uniref:Predicted protein n=1 Tax=Laccaria bicolor (strain S238N-H82 / ATCC MYA-4686) TaxID=486041 RepID=B0DLR6_LACBS|nr:uncharacterized protein LACBIDRAFT_330573 [Laccaria bicolor S238N-H82]EDR04341.1 predicted protein [Laccaria bicolor S238N-H82]|eukprot:XP_001884860.1 predicted protein [Laccaria bicolor S238N-H82]